MVENKKKKISTRAAVARAKIQAAIRREVEQRGAIMTPSQRTQATFYTDEEGQVIGGEVPQVSAGGQVIGGQSFGSVEAQKELKKIEIAQERLEAVKRAREIPKPADRVSFSGLQSTTPGLQIKAALGVEPEKDEIPSFKDFWKPDISGERLEEAKERLGQQKEFITRAGVSAGISGAVFGGLAATGGAPLVALGATGYGLVAAQRFTEQSLILGAYYGGSSIKDVKMDFPTWAEVVGYDKPKKAEIIAAETLAVQTVKTPEFIGGLVGAGIGASAGMLYRTPTIGRGRFRTLAGGLEGGEVVALTKGVVGFGKEILIVESIALGKQIIPAKVVAGKNYVTPAIDLAGLSRVRTTQPGKKPKGFGDVEPFLGVTPGWTGYRAGLTAEGASVEQVLFRAKAGESIYEAGPGMGVGRKGRDPIVYDFERVLTKLKETPRKDKYKKQRVEPTERLEFKESLFEEPLAEAGLVETKPGKAERDIALKSKEIWLKEAETALTELNKPIFAKQRAVGYVATTQALEAGVTQLKKQSQKRMQKQEQAFKQSFAQSRRTKRAQVLKFDQSLKFKLGQPLMQKPETELARATFITPIPRIRIGKPVKFGFPLGRRMVLTPILKYKKIKQKKKYAPSLAAAVLKIESPIPKKLTGLEIRPLRPAKKRQKRR